jgi:hypothetical protein
MKSESPNSAQISTHSGGVLEILDYELNPMIEFVTAVVNQITCRIDLQISCIGVSQVLFSTRLPSSTILLGLTYLLNRANAGDIKCYNAEEVHQAFCLSMVLGTKFMDDFTFSNKTWSEISGIPLDQLNSIERGWLKEMNWSLYLTPDGTLGLEQLRSLWDLWMNVSDCRHSRSDHLVQNSYHENLWGRSYRKRKPSEGVIDSKLQNQSNLRSQPRLVHSTQAEPHDILRTNSCTISNTEADLLESGRSTRFYHHLPPGLVHPAHRTSSWASTTFEDYSLNFGGSSGRYLRPPPGIVHPGWTSSIDYHNPRASASIRKLEDYLLSSVKSARGHPNPPPGLEYLSQDKPDADYTEKIYIKVHDKCTQYGTRLNVASYPCTPSLLPRQYERNYNDSSKTGAFLNSNSGPDSLSPGQTRRRYNSPLPGFDFPQMNICIQQLTLSPYCDSKSQGSAFGSITRNVSYISPPKEPVFTAHGNPCDRVRVSSCTIPKNDRQPPAPRTGTRWFISTPQGPVHPMQSVCHDRFANTYNGKSTDRRLSAQESINGSNVNPPHGLSDPGPHISGDNCGAISYSHTNTDALLPANHPYNHFRPQPTTRSSHLTLDDTNQTSRLMSRGISNNYHGLAAQPLTDRIDAFHTPAQGRFATSKLNFRTNFGPLLSNESHLYSQSNGQPVNFAVAPRDQCQAMRKLSATITTGFVRQRSETTVRPPHGVIYPAHNSLNKRKSRLFPTASGTRIHRSKFFPYILFDKGPPTAFSHPTIPKNAQACREFLIPFHSLRSFLTVPECACH